MVLFVETVVQGVGRYGGIKVYAVLRDDSADYLKDNHHWEALFHVDDPGPRVPIEKGQYLDAKQALDVVRFDIQYCDWRARQDLLTIMVLHNKVYKLWSELVFAVGSEKCFCLHLLNFTLVGTDQGKA